MPLIVGSLRIRKVGFESQDSWQSHVDKTGSDNFTAKQVWTSRVLGDDLNNVCPVSQKEHAKEPSLLNGREKV